MKSTWAAKGNNHYQRKLVPGFYVVRLEYKKGDTPLPPVHSSHPQRTTSINISGTITVTANGSPIATNSFTSLRVGGPEGQLAWKLTQFWIHSNALVDVYCEGDIASILAEREITSHRAVK